jgi:hypothetical protein
MGKTLTKSFKLDEEQYERWEEFINESVEVESFSQLVRLAVSAYVAGDKARDPRTMDKAREDTSAELLQRMNELQNEFDRERHKLEMQNERIISELRKPLKLAILDILPQQPSETKGESRHDIMEWAITEQELSSKLEESKGRIRGILSELKSEFGQVGRYQSDESDEIYWYLRS